MGLLHKIKQYIPILDWLPNYKKSNLSSDLSAGLTVGIMLIPQGMAYAMLAGLEPIHGLYAVTVPLVLYAVFGTSRQLAVGPVAMVSLLTAAGIGGLQPESPEQYLLFAITLAFLVGLIQFLLGILKFGFIVNFLSHPVINGFTSAAAIIIGLSQIKHLFKIDLPRTEHVHELLIALGENIYETHWATFSIGIAGILIIKFGKKLHKKLPVALVAVVIGIFVVWGFDLANSGVEVLGEVPAGLPTFSSPSFDLASWSVLLPIALAISLVGFAESYAVAKTIHGKHKNYKLDPNQELIALGMANFGAAFFKGYPVTGGFARSAVNDQAGSKTALSSIFSALLIILTLLFFTRLFYYLPNAILAALVIVAVSGLIDFKTPKKLWNNDRIDFLMLIATFLSTMTLGIEIGIISGLGLSLLAMIYKSSRPHVAQLGQVPGTNYFRNVKRFDTVKIRPDILIARIDGPIYFANVQFIKGKIDHWVAEKGEELKLLVLNFESVISIDSSGAHELETWINTWKEKGINTSLTGAKGPVRDVLSTWELTICVGKENIFIDDASAVDFYDNLNEEEIRKLSAYALESKKG